MQPDKLALSYELANGLWSKLLSMKKNWQANLTSVLSDWGHLQSLIACEQEQPLRAMSGWMNSNGLFQKNLKAFVYSGSLLLQRKAWPPYQNEPWAGRRLVIVGAGPVGIRMAIEALLLGAEVDVVEARNKFSRVNVLKMWSFASADLASLGLKDLGLMFGQGYDKININMLQHALSRLLLVLGGRLHVAKLAGELRTLDGKWLLPLVDSKTKQEVSTLPFDALVDATGKVAAVSKRQVCGRKVFDFHVKNYASGGSSQRRAAITANWHRFSGDMGRQFHKDYDAVAAKMTEYEKDVDSRVRVADLVTFQSPLSNYMVMSVLIDELEKLGVFKSTEKRNDVYALLNSQNIDSDKLADVVEMVAEDWKIPHDGKAGMLTGINKMSIFEFMDMQYSVDPLDNETSMVQALPDANSCTDLRGESSNVVKPQFMLAVGDTLWAPFWPEGTGMSRGILSVNHAGFALTRLWQSELTGQQLRETLKWADRWSRAGVFATNTDCDNDRCSPASVQGYVEEGYGGAEPQSFHDAMESFADS